MSFSPLFDTARRWVVYILRLLVASLETPDETVFNLAVGSGEQIMCARIAIDLEIFEHLARKSPQTVSDLAKVTDGEPLLLERLLRCLAAMGFVKEVGEDTFAPSPVTYQMLKPNVRAGYIHWHDIGMPALTAMPAYFRQNGYRSPPHSTKGPVQYAFNTRLDTYHYLQTKPEVAKNFNTFMQGHFAGKRLDWLEWFPLQTATLSGFSEKQSPYVFVDVGGGRGHEAHAVKTKFPTAPGIVVLEDLPEVIEDGSSIHPDIKKVKQNFFEENQIRGSRTYYIAHVMHNWPTDECVQILKNVRDAMTPGYSKILICDLILPDAGVSLRHAALDLGMMTLHSGMQRSKKQWAELVSRAGLRVEKFWMSPRGDGEGIVQAVRDN